MLVTCDNIMHNKQQNQMYNEKRHNIPICKSKQTYLQQTGMQTQSVVDLTQLRALIFLNSFEVVIF